MSRIKDLKCLGMILETGKFQPTNWCACRECAIKGRYEWCNNKPKFSNFDEGCPFGKSQPPLSNGRGLSRAFR